MTPYKRMILRNILSICVIFSLFFTASFYIERYFSAKNEYSENIRQNLDSITGKIDGASMQIQDLSIIFRSNADFKGYVESPHVSPYLRQAVTAYIHSSVEPLSATTGVIAVLRPDDDYIISSNSAVKISSFLYNYGLPSDDILNIVQSQENFSSPPYIFFSSAKGKTYFTLLLADSTNFSKPYFIFNVYDFDQFLASLDSDTLILINSDGTPIYYSSGLSRRDAEKILENKHMFKYITATKSANISTASGNLAFTIILSKAKYIFDVNRHIFVTLLAFLILLLLSVWVSRKVSNKTYSPIQKLVEQVSTFNSDARENEFDAISSAISVLSKRNSALTNIVANNRTELKEKFINDLLHGYLTEEQVAKGIKSYLKNSKKMLPLAIIVTDLQENVAEAALENGADVSSLNLVISSLFGQEFENESFFHFTVLSPTSYCIIVSCNNLDELKLRVRRLLLTVETDLNFNMYSSVSDYIKAWKDLPSAFFTTYFAHTTLKSQEISQKVYSHSEISNPILYSYEIDSEIFSHCLRREREQLNNSLDFLMKENFASSEEFTKRQSQMSVLIFALCMRILTSINTDSETVFGEDYNIYLELRSCSSSEDFRKLLGFIFENIIDYIEQSQSVYEQSYYDNMLNFINENYSTNISLTDLAEHMNMSQSYVSRLFKRLTNSNFKDYLSKVRIKEAEKLLSEHPEKSIKEVSLAVGFNTVKTFSAIFLKVNGMTPSEYRRIQQKKR